MGKIQKLEILKDGFTLGGDPFYLASGDMHYFRFFKGGWKRRLQLMKDFGLTAVQTYVPWNLHEPEKGEYCFEGNLDLKEFLNLCQEVGLYVMFRPSPYMCSEWDWGGLPYWLMNEKDISIRTYNEVFLENITAYYERLAKEFIPFLSTNGGPIIAVAVENEYGSFADDDEYLKYTGELLRRLGVDVPLYTANGINMQKFCFGARDEFWNTIDVHGFSDEEKARYLSLQPDKAMFAAEFWSGRSQQWGGYFSRQNPEDVGKLYKGFLEKNLYVNFYMFCGGTNFGFQNGALVGRYGSDLPGAKNRFIPFATSYDVDALVSEYGNPTQKYFVCQQILREDKLKKGFEDTSKDVSGIKVETQETDRIKLTKSADLLDNLENLSVKSKKWSTTLTFEDLNQAYGFMLYTTYVRYTDDKPNILRIEGLHDRAIVFGNGKYLGTMMRDRENEPVIFNIPKDGLKLDILVESMGRVNFGYAMLKEHKGITDFVAMDTIEADGSQYLWNYSFKTGWEHNSLPLKDLSGIDYSKTAKADRPAFFSGEFKAKKGVDTFLDMSGWDKGVVWINGFNLGRYWKIGPQGTLYVPGELLEENNTITVLELHNPNEDKSVKFESKPNLDTIAPPNAELKVSEAG